MANRLIEVTPANYETLKFLYEKAQRGNLDKFKFQGQFIVTSYAKYMIEYMESIL